jgi:hypothetical protein
MRLGSVQVVAFLNKTIGSVLNKTIGSVQVVAFLSKPIGSVQVVALLNLLSY